MQRNIDDWLDCLPPELCVEISRILEISKDYMIENKEFFKNSGLYIVGSSLEDEKLDKEDFGDIDIVIVGLDFRQVFNYTQKFLTGPSEEEYKEYQSELKKGSHPPHPTFYLPREISSHGEIIELAYLISGNTSWGFFEPSHPGMMANPFATGPYITDALEQILVSRINLEQDYVLFKPSDKPTLDLMFHAENLTVSAWKKAQKQTNAPYIPALELYDPNNDTIENRPKFEIELPHYIDSKGQKRNRK